MKIDKRGTKRDRRVLRNGDEELGIILSLHFTEIEGII